MYLLAMMLAIVSSVRCMLRWMVVLRIACNSMASKGQARRLRTLLTIAILFKIARRHDVYFTFHKSMEHIAKTFAVQIRQALKAA